MKAQQFEMRAQMFEIKRLRAYMKYTRKAIVQTDKPYITRKSRRIGRTDLVVPCVKYGAWFAMPFGGLITKLPFDFLSMVQPSANNSSKSWRTALSLCCFLAIHKN
jgi:hypothetical protein